MRASWLVTVGLLALSACGAHGATGGPGPSTAVEAWRDAVARDDPKAAYGLLAPEMKKKLSYAEFERRWKETKAERERQAGALGAESGDADATAEITLPDGQKAALERDKGFWRMRQPLIRSTHASKPAEALRLFADALEQRNFYDVMRLMTSTRKDGLDDFLDTFVRGLRDHAAKEITISDDRAVIEWREGSKTWKVTLRKEDGEWRVDDVDFY
jgi:hypothetical protein